MSIELRVNNGPPKQFDNMAELVIHVLAGTSEKVEEDKIILYFDDGSSFKTWKSCGS